MTQPEKPGAPILSPFATTKERSVSRTASRPTPVSGSGSSRAARQTRAPRRRIGALEARERLERGQKPRERVGESVRRRNVRAHQGTSSGRYYGGESDGFLHSLSRPAAPQGVRRRPQGRSAPRRVPRRDSDRRAPLLRRAGRGPASRRRRSAHDAGRPVQRRGGRGDAPQPAPRRGPRAGPSEEGQRGRALVLRSAREGEGSGPGRPRRRPGDDGRGRSRGGGRCAHLRAHRRSRPRARAHARDADEKARGGRRALRARLRSLPLPEPRRGHPAHRGLAVARARVRPRHRVSIPSRDERGHGDPHSRRRDERRTALARAAPSRRGRAPGPQPFGARPRVRGRARLESSAPPPHVPAAPRRRSRVRLSHDVAPRRIRPHAAGAAARAGAREARGRRPRQGAAPRCRAPARRAQRVRGPPPHGPVGPDRRLRDRVAHGRRARPAIRLRRLRAPARPGRRAAGHAGRLRQGARELRRRGDPGRPSRAPRDGGIAPSAHRRRIGSARRLPPADRGGRRAAPGSAGPSRRAPRVPRRSRGRPRAP